MAVERIIPEAVGTYDPIDLREHLARYEFAYQYVKDGFVGLDIACGSGYGTNFTALIYVRKPSIMRVPNTETIKLSLYRKMRLRSILNHYPLI